MAPATEGERAVCGSAVGLLSPRCTPEEGSPAAFLALVRRTLRPGLMVSGLLVLPCELFPQHGDRERGMCELGKRHRFCKPVLVPLGRRFQASDPLRLHCPSRQAPLGRGLYNRVGERTILPFSKILPPGLLLSVGQKEGLAEEEKKGGRDEKYPTSLSLGSGGGN